MIAATGTPETIVRRFSDDFRLKFTVTVASSADEARAVVEISRDGQILTRQSSRILLQRSGRTVQPVE